uniref:Fatty acid desaturase 2-2 n=1 Tax=Brassica juncea TaxID=3707 RepID=D9IFB5_BRAJU|nr:fatty acid desaturase 2-2 [Brassica juncea]
MGAGGRMQVSPSPKKSETDTLKRVPCETPPFTVGELKKAIPPHCFKRSIPRSFSYLIWDIIVASCFYYVATTYFPLLPHPLSYMLASLLGLPRLRPNRRLGHSPRMRPPRFQRLPVARRHRRSHLPLFPPRPLLLLEVQSSPPPLQHRLPRERRGVCPQEEIRHQVVRQVPQQPSRTHRDVNSPVHPRLAIVLGFQRLGQTLPRGVRLPFPPERSHLQRP